MVPRVLKITVMWYLLVCCFVCVTLANTDLSSDGKWYCLPICKIHFAYCWMYPRISPLITIVTEGFFNKKLRFFGFANVYTKENSFDNLGNITWHSVTIVNTLINRLTMNQNFYGVNWQFNFKLRQF